MGILQLPTQVPAQVGVLPNMKFMVSTDNLATITTAAYLNGVALESNPIANTDILMVLYNYNIQSTSGTFGIFTVSITNGVITLVQWADSGNVNLPVVSGNIATFNGTSGQITDSGVAAANVMKLNSANVMAAGGSITLLKSNGTEAANAVTTAAGNAGVITTSALTTAGGASYAITWTNSQITAGSVILLSIMGGTNTTENITLKAVAGAGTATLTIYNNTAATALNGTILIGYSVL